MPQRELQPRRLFKRWAALTLGAAALAGLAVHLVEGGFGMPGERGRIWIPPVGVALGSVLGYCRFGMNTRFLTRLLDRGGKVAEVDKTGEAAGVAGADAAAGSHKLGRAGTLAAVIAGLYGVAGILIQAVFLAVCIKKSLPLFAGGAAGLLIMPVTLLISRRQLRL